MYNRERALLSHYAKNRNYYSTASELYLDDILNMTGVKTKEGRLLDIGCGDGRASIWASSHGMDYTGVDYCPERIALAKKRWGGPGKVFHCQDIYAYMEAIAPQSVDCLLAFEVLEHLERPDRIVQGIRKALRPEGVGVGTVPVNMPYVAHLQLFRTEDDVRQALEPDDIFRYRTKLHEHFILVWFHRVP